MKINKSQCQSLHGYLGIDLSSSCFSHGQLYDTLSRATRPEKVYMSTENIENKARNGFILEVLSDTRSTVPKFRINSEY